MCGIAGFFDFKHRHPADAGVLARMCAVMVHRGPDAEGTLLDGPVALGMRRLSIIDVDGGQQPIGNEDGRIQVVLNGEIYNYQRLREQLIRLGHQFRTRSDTEVLVHLYEEYGVDCLQHLDGMFAFALWDGRCEQLLLARDRMGEKPLYYGVFEGQIIWGSELKCLLVHPSVQPRLDLASVAAYLQQEYVPAPQSIVEGISKLRPAHYLLVSQGTVRTERYWRFDAVTGIERGGPSRAADLPAVLREAVRSRLVADVPVGVFLSGGIDSSLVTALAAAEYPGRLQTFAVGFDARSFDESAHARAVARHFGTIHHELRLGEPELLSHLEQVTRILDEPFGDPSVIPTYAIATFAAQHVKVVLGGDGGDELFGGYPTYQASRAAAWLDQLHPIPKAALVRLTQRLVGYLPTDTRNLSLEFKLKRFFDHMPHPWPLRQTRWLGAWDPVLQGSLWHPDLHPELDLSRLDRGMIQLSDACQGLDPVTRAMWLDCQTYLPDDILFKMDRAGMAASLETRAPFLANAVLDFAAHLPAEDKLRGWTTKWALRRSGEGLLPEAILRRPKKGFGVPVAEWLKGDLREAMLDLLSEARLKRQGLFDGACVTRLVREHLSGTRDHRKCLWTLLMFEWWADHYPMVTLSHARH